MAGSPNNNPYPFPGMYPIYPFPTPNAPSPWFTPVPPSMRNQPSDMFNPSYGGQETKSHGFLGSIKDFGKGIVNGAVNTVKGMFTLKGLAITAGSLALAWLAPAIFLPVLTLGALAYGGMQIFKGASTGNWEKAGEGVFTLGATLLGAKFGSKLEPGIKDADGTKYVFTKTVAGNKEPVTGLLDKLVAYGKALLPIKSGKLHPVSPAGRIASDSKNAYQLGWESISDKFGGLRDRFRR